MSLKALFISVADLKKKSIIDGNVDSDKIVQYIEIAQDIHIQNYLGGSLYKKLQELIIAGTITDVGRYINGDLVYQSPFNLCKNCDARFIMELIIKS